MEKVEEKRKALLHSDSRIIRKDFGAGSHSIRNTTPAKVSQIARSALSKPFQCRFLARLVKWSDATSILELGTSLGISAAYMAIVSEEGKIITIEGDPEIAKIAGQLFHELELKNISLVNQNFDDFIQKWADQLPSIDLLFIDGNHRSESLLKYYMAFRSRFHPKTIVMVDDIYWSGDMHAGWQQLITLPEVTQSVDCFHFGLLFFGKEFLIKEHHKARLPLSALTGQ